MSLNPRNVISLLEKSFDRPEYEVQSVITEAERCLASYLEGLIKDSIDTNFFVESFECLNYNDSVYPDAKMVDEEIDYSSEDCNFDSKRPKMCFDIDIEYKKRAVEFWRSGKKKRRSFEAVQHKFKKVPSIKYLYNWEQQIEEGGTRNEKLLKISEFVLEEFNNALDKSVAVHDFDLKRWALKARAKVNLDIQLFTASKRWIHNFKLKHGIVSRKINKFVIQRQIDKNEELLQSSSDYVSKVRSEIKNIGVENVYNSDQSGFNLESHAGRTLSFRGTLKVESLAQSLNSLTHSYTIQPTISASGELKSPLMIVLQESKGNFGPLIEKTIYKARNIVTFASKSGKMTSELSTSWYKDVFLPNTKEDSLLLLDSWTGQKDTLFDTIDKGQKKVKILTIPPGATGFVQPLDVYTFRPWKNFLKQFSDLIILYNYDVNLHLRNNILKIQSLIHNQFSSPRFVNLFKYAWWKSGYIEEKPAKCQTPVEYCLKGCGTICDVCDDIAIMKCAWCTKSMCMEHFFAVSLKSSPHYCEQYII